MNADIVDKIVAAVKTTLKQYVNGCHEATVNYLVGDATHSKLCQSATNKAVEGDYLGALICEEAAKLIPDAPDTESESASASGPRSNVDAELTVLKATEVEVVDAMLCVTGTKTLGCGVCMVTVFHHDGEHRLVGIRHRDFKDMDLVVKLGDGVTLRYVEDDRCGNCGEEFTKKDIGGGRCLSCGSMIT